MSEEREHTSRHNKTGESPSKNPDDQITRLFETILQHIRDIHLSQESLKFPSIFLVYAHENKKLAPASANAKGALDLIKWLGKVRFNLHSDKTHGYDPLNTTSEDIQNADAEKIVSSQLRLLPPEGSSDSFDHVILCGSEVLGEYARSPYWDEYLKHIETAYQTALEASEPDGSTHVRIRKMIRDVVQRELGRDGFHHVLTELACLCIRTNKSENKSESHGIIPILLNGTEECFPKFIQDSDTIRIEPKSGPCRNQHLHRGFFRLLKRLLRQKGEEIEAFQTYYEQCVKKLQTEPALKEKAFLRLADEEYRKVQQKLIGNSDATIRDGKFLITLASTLKVPLENLRNALETYTSRQCQSIERVSGQSLSMDRCYINLAVVEQQENKVKGRNNKADGKEKSAEDKDPQTLSETFRRLPSIEATDANPQLLFPLQDLFKPRKLIDGRTAVPKRILILGRAGVGKTTLSKKILYEYTWGRKWRDLFDWVLLVPLRKLKQKHFGSLTDVFGETYFQQEPRGQVFAQTLRERILGPDRDKTLFILDGLDEIQGWEADESMKTILPELLDHPRVIITSRPTGADLKHKDLQLETIGFGRKDVWAFLEVKEIVASEEDSTAIKQWIERNSFVQEVVNVPIQLDALCYSWDEIKRRQQTDDSFTMTTLYQAMIQKLWRKDILRLEKQDQGRVLTKEIVREIRLPRRLERAVQPEIDLLDALAFERFQADQIEFGNSEIDHVIEQLETPDVQLPLTLENNLTKLSVLHTNDNDSTGDQRSYFFMHLTFQEFHAARWLVKQVASNRSQLENCVRQHKYNPRYEIFWRFVAGLLPPGGALNFFFDCLNQEPQDLLGIQHQHLIMHLLNESRHHLDPKRQQALESQLNEWLEFEVEITTSSTLGTTSSTLGTQVAFPEAQILLRLEDESRRRGTLELLYKRPVLSTRVLDRLMALLKADDRNAQRLAEWALRRQTNLPKEAICGLVALLNDREAKGSAMEMLGRRTNLPKEAIDDLVVLLNNGNEEVQDSAAETLGAQTNLPKEVIDGLTALLKLDGMARCSAAKVLGRQTNLPKEVIDDLVALLDNNNQRVRDSATEALGRQTNLPKEVIDGLAALLKLDGMARYSAAKVLYQQKNLPKEVIDGLVPLLKVDDWKAQGLACIALYRQTNLPKEAIDDLVALMNNGDRNVQSSAAAVLRRQTNLHKEAIGNLMALLNNGDKNVRSSAVDVLCRQTNLHKEAIDDLVALLKVGDWNVQFSATEALSWQPNLPKKVIDGLVPLLKVDDWKAQRLACIALERQTNLPKQAIDDLVALLNNDNEEVQRPAADLLGRQTNLPIDAIDSLVALLEADSWEARALAAKVLGLQSNLPKKAIDGLVTLLKVDDWRMQLPATEALGRQTNIPPEVIDGLVAFLKENRAVRAFGRQTNLPNEVIDGLVALLKADDWRVRDPAFAVLGRQTKLPKGVIDGLVALLEADAEGVQYLAAESLGLQTNLPIDAIDGLVALLEADDIIVQRSAARALAKQTNLLQKDVERLIGLLDSIQEASVALRGQSTGELYRLLPTLKDSLQTSLYSKCLVKRSFDERAPLYLEGNTLHFYTSSGLESVVLLDEAAFRRTILEAQKAAHIPSASWVKLVSSSQSQQLERGDEV